MERERINGYCEWAVTGLVLAALVFGSLAFGAVRPSEYLVVEGLTMAAVGVWLFRLWFIPGMRLLWPPVCWAVLAFAVYAVARYWYADVEYIARRELVRVLLCAVLFLVSVNNLHRRRSIRTAVYILVLLGTVQACYGAYQFITHAPTIWGFARPERFLDRASGTYINPNHLAGLLDMILPLALAYTIASRARPLGRIFLGYGVLAMAVGIVLAMSRGGWVATAFGLLFLLGLLMQTARQWLALALSILLLAGGGFLLFSQSITLRLRAEDMRRSLIRAQYDARYALNLTAIKMWKAHFWFGAGPGHFDLRFTAFRPEHQLLQGKPDRVHNDYLNTLADWGLTGAVLVGLPFLLVAGSLVRHWRHLRRVKGDANRKGGGVFPLIAGASAGLAAILVHSATDFNMHIPANALVAVLLLALLAAHVRFATERHWIAATLPVRLLLTLLLLAVLTFLAVQGWKSEREDVWVRQADSPNLSRKQQIAALEKAFAAEPNNPWTAYLIAENYRWQSWEGGDDYVQSAEQAMEWFERAARLDSYSSLNALGMAACLDWLERTSDSEPWYEKALKLDPNGHRVRAQIGWHKYLLGDYPAAMEWCDKALALAPYDDLAIKYFRLAYAKVQEQKKAGTTK